MDIYLGRGAKEPVSRYVEGKETKCCMTQGNQGFYTDNAKKDSIECHCSSASSNTIMFVMESSQRYHVIVTKNVQCTFPTAGISIDGCFSYVLTFLLTRQEATVSAGLGLKR